MDLVQTAQALAQTVATLAALDPEARRAPLAALYKELIAADLPEPVAAAIQHQLALAADGAGAVTQTLATGGGTALAGAASTERN